jgi:Beta-lactamase enzyme family
MINSPVDKEKVTTSPTEPFISTDRSVSQPSSTSIKNLVMTIGVLVTASLSGYFGLMLIHKALLPPTTAPVASPLKPVLTIPTAKPSEPLTSNVQTKIQPTKQTHQIALTFKNSNRSLDRAIDKIINHCQKNHFSTDSLSISLVNLKTGERTGYKNDLKRYPASVVKMFWLFKAYNDQTIDPNLRIAMDKMILKSDNNGASQVLDHITKTKSSKTELSQQEFKAEQQKRNSLNTFYQDKGYSPSLNISQKTFPITNENIMEPQGFDKQLRGTDTRQPVRNKITTDDATLLMSEIIKNPNQEMRKLLTRNIDPNFWRKQPPNPIEFNPVESFFGAGLEGLDSKVISKAGWTSGSRQEVAYIKSKDGKTEYILTVFGDSADYAKNKKIFPEISRLVYKEMQNISKNKSMN